MTALTLCVVFCAAAYASPSVEKFFDEYDDLTSLKWKNNVNSRTSLHNVLLADNIHILQADVTTGPDEEPGMTDDDAVYIKLTEYLNILINHNIDRKNYHRKKALQLNFKDSDTFELAVNNSYLLKDDTLRSDINFPLIISAEVVEGPQSESPVVVLAKELLLKLDTATIALGWTGPTIAATKEPYTNDHLKAMEEMVKDLDIKPSHNISFNVRAIFAAETEKLKDLLGAGSTSTLTIWSPDNAEESRAVNTSKLMNLYVEHKERVYLNLPDDLEDRLAVSPSIKKFFPDHDDLTSFKWKNSVNSKKSLTNILKDENIHILQADVSIVNEKPGMMGDDDDIPLTDYLGIMIYHNNDIQNEHCKKALQLNFKDTDTFELAVSNEYLLKFDTLRFDITFPLIISAEVVVGPQGGNSFVNLDKNLLSKLNTATIALGWTGPTSTVTKEPYTNEHIRAMIDMVNTLDIKTLHDISFNVRAIFAAETEKLRGLIGEKTTLSIWSSESAAESRAVDPSKLLDLYAEHKDSVYLNLPVDLQGRLDNSNIPRTTDFFPGFIEDLSKLKWAHAANKQADLTAALKNKDVRMIEVDVWLDDDVPVLKHESDNYEITVVALIDKIIEHNKYHLQNKKGIKLDFKQEEALNASVVNGVLLKHGVLRKDIDFPLWINADVCDGPNSNVGDSIVMPDPDIVALLKGATFSLGWTTEESISGTGEYTQDQIDDMDKISKYLSIDKEEITYPVRALYAANSYDTLSGLISVDNRSLTIWSAEADTEFVNVDNLRKLIKVNKRKVFVDVPNDLQDMLESSNVQRVVDYFPKFRDNVSTLKWAHAANKLAEITQALTNTEIRMIEVDVWVDLKTRKPVLKYKDEDSYDTTVDQLIEKIIQHNNDGKNVNNKKGIKLDFKQNEALTSSLTNGILLDNNGDWLRSDIDFPLWIHADICKGPMGDAPNVVLNSDVVTLLKGATFSLGWTTGDPDNYGNGYTQQQIVDIIMKLKDLNINKEEVTFEVRAAYAVESYDILTDLIKSDSRSLTIWSAKTDTKSVDVDKLQKLINNNKKKVFVDVPKDLQDKLDNSNIPRTIDFFPGFIEDLSKLKWAHAANKQADLTAALKNKDVRMIEVDVWLDDDVPVLKHESDNYEITVVALIDKIIEHNKYHLQNKKGIKLDFKQEEALNASVVNGVLLKHGVLRKDIDFPLWINADVCDGPNSNVGDSIVMPDPDIVALLKGATFSLGWTTEESISGTGEYTQDQIDDMDKISKYLSIDKEEITYPVRALYAANSYDTLSGLISVDNRSLTIWSAEADTEFVNVDNLRKLIKVNKRKVFVDVPNDLQDMLESSNVQRVVDYFPKFRDNVSTLKWAHAANKLAEITQALTNTEIRMIEVDVWVDLKTRKPVLKYKDEDSYDTTVDQLIEKIIQHNNDGKNVNNKKGIKLDFKQNEALTSSLTNGILLDNNGDWLRSDIDFPLWIHADICKGPMGDAPNVVLNSDVVTLLKGATFSLGWTTGDPDNYGNGYTQQQIVDIIMKLKDLNINKEEVTFEVRAAYAVESYDILTDLIKSDSRSLTIWSAKTDTKSVDVDKLQKLINNNKKKVFVDVPKDLQDKLDNSNIPRTIDFFPGFIEDLSKLKWAHAANKQADLTAALKNKDVRMIEVDVWLDDDVPVLKHESDNYEITVVALIDKIIEHNKYHLQNKKGIKLDFKQEEALNACMVNGVLLKHGVLRKDIDFPLWINADVCDGPNSNVGDSIVMPDPDIVALLKGATFSLGWTTEDSISGTEEYTQDQIDDMDKISKYLSIDKEEITYPVRALYAANSYDTLSGLINVDNRSLTIWSAEADTEFVNVDNLRKLIKVNKRKVFVDVPNDLQDMLESSNVQRVVDYFPKFRDNVSTLKWAHAANELAEITQALTNTEIRMIEVDVWLDLKTRKPVLKYKDEGSYDTTVDQLIEKIIQHNNDGKNVNNKKGIKLDFKQNEALTSSLTNGILLDNNGDWLRSDIDFPLWIHADICKGPMGDAPNVVLSSDVVTLLKGATFSLGWTTGDPDNYGNGYTQQQIVDIIMKLKDLNINKEEVTFEVRAAYAVESYDILTDLIKSDSRSLTIWSAETDTKSVDVDKLQKLINNNKKKVFVDVPKHLQDKLENSNVIRVVDFFPEFKGDVSKLKWAHAANKQVDLNDALKNKEVRMIEVDVRLQGGVPVLKHDEEDSYEITVAELIDKINEHNKYHVKNKKGVKLDFKQEEALAASVSNGVLLKYDVLRKDIDFPLWINADICEGPMSTDTPVTLKPNVIVLLKGATISLGWTTGSPNDGSPNDGAYEYTEAQIGDMVDQIDHLGIDQEEITYAVRAIYAAESYNTITDLINSDNRSLTIWSPEADTASVDVYQLRKLIKNNKEKIFVDVPKDLQDRLEASNVPRVVDFFPELTDDVSKLKWAHAANKECEIISALQDTEVRMIEVDVWLGIGLDRNVPVLKHEDEVYYDTTVEELITTISKHNNDNENNKKGIKLDFKQNDALTSSVKKGILLDENGDWLRSDIDFPLWINADICKGPMGDDPNIVLNTDVVTLLKGVTFSLGWTTGEPDNYANGYTKEQIIDITKIIKNLDIDKEEITYSVRAAYAAESYDILTELIKSDDRSLTISSAKTDTKSVDVEKLRVLINNNRKKVFVDVPKDLQQRVGSNIKRVVDFFPELKDDMSKLKWAHAANKQTDLNKALENEEVHMIEVDVWLQDDIPVLKHDQSDKHDTTVAELIDKIIEHNKYQLNNKKGIKLDFKQKEAVEKSVTNGILLKNGIIRYDIDFPLWINADISKGPNGADPTVVLNRNVSTLLKGATFSLGWTTGNPHENIKTADDRYQLEQINDIDDNIINLNLNDEEITYSVRAVYAAESYNVLTDLINKENRSLTIWSADTDTESVDVDKLRKLIRDNKKKVFVDVPKDLQNRLESTNIKSIVDFFPEFEVKYNVSELKWAHAANNEAKVTDALNDAEVRMIEVDVWLENDVPVLKHNEEDEYDTTVYSLINRIIDHNTDISNKDNKKGIKLDFKHEDALTQSLTDHVLLDNGSLRRDIDFPLWVNADISKGPNGNNPAVVLDQKQLKLLNGATFSLGWTTGNPSTASKILNTNMYTQEQINDITQEISKLRIGDEEITYPVRAVYAAESYDILSKLIKSNKRSLTIWSAEQDTELVDVEKLRKLIQDHKSKVFVDVPKDLDDRINSASLRLPLTALLVTFFALIRLVT